MEINVVMLTDNNYISQARVAMYSVCKSRDENVKIKFTILCDKSLGRQSRERLFLLQEHFPNIIVSFLEVEEEDFINAKSNYRVPIVSCYRLVAAKVLDVEKVIYLDVDVIVEMDISELYKINIENYYIAGVKDLYPVLSPNFALWYSECFNIKDFSDYVNCGVLLMNLELMRKDHIVEIFLNELKQKNLWLDQDILNRVCHGKIRLLDWHFNHISCYTDKEYELNCSSSEKRRDKEIVHYAGGNEEPWKDCFSKLADKWWKVAKEALEEDIYEKMYRIASIGYRFRELSEIVLKCLEVQTVIIVGYSNHGVFIRNALFKYGITADIVFCDNNFRKRNLMLINEKIYSPEEAAEKFKKAIWVNAVQNQRYEIIKQLRELNISDEWILNFYETEREVG